MRIIFVFLCLLCAGCSGVSIQIKERANPGLLKQSVTFLADSLNGRAYHQLENLNKSVEYIRGKFESYGLPCEIQEYYSIEDDYNQAAGNSYKNLYCTLEGISDSVFIVGAHYDSFGDLPAADDNASGVAGILETARILTKEKQPHYTIVFVAFTLEEPPFFHTEEMGSYKFAELVKDLEWPVVGMVSVEMIGYFTDEKVQEYPVGIMSWFYPSRGNYIAAVSNFSNSHLSEEYQDHVEAFDQIDCQKLAAPSSVPGVDFSDHASFWKFGYEAFMITNTAFYRNKNYHTEDDTSGRLDYVKMGYVVNALANMLLLKEE